MTALKDQSPESLVGRRFKFVVRSAEEAVQLIRENLGTSARVLSVRQLEGKGLSRLMHSPKLEVIATIPPPEEASEAAPSDTAIPTAEGNGVLQEPGRSEVGIAANDKPATPWDAGTAEADTYTRERVSKPTAQLGDFLRKAHFDDSLIARLEHSPEWTRLKDLSLGRALGEVYQWLGQEFRTVDTRPVGQRVAFFGPPATGKTTSLCKQVANEVMVNGRTGVQVIKVDSDDPNPDEALRVFCDIMGTPLWRFPSDLSHLPADKPLYADIAGVSLQDRAGWQACRDQLDELGCDSRVLVLNAAYDAELLKALIRRGDEMGATHLVFTHLDELSNPNRLWQYLLRSGMPTLFYSHGSSITGECTRDIVPFMMERAVPGNFEPSLS